MIIACFSCHDYPSLCRIQCDFAVSISFCCVDLSPPMSNKTTVFPVLVVRAIAGAPCTRIHRHCRKTAIQRPGDTAKFAARCITLVGTFTPSGYQDINAWPHCPGPIAPKMRLPFSECDDDECLASARGNASTVRGCEDDRASQPIPHRRAHAGGVHHARADGRG